MSSVSGEELLGEDGFKSVKGEGHDHDDHLSYQDLQIEEVIEPKSLTFKEASSCLHMLGKDESGMRYAYLMITCIDRKLTEISVLLQFVHVLFLDLGGNKIDLDGFNILEGMPYLLFLKADKNIVQSAELNPCSLLQILNFSRNKIIRTRGVKQPLLECLDLNYNFIDDVELTQEDVPNLKLLEIRGNILGALKGIYPASLDSLYLAQNRIQFLDEATLSRLVNLRVLHLRDNFIHKLDGFSDSLCKLKYLNLRKNNITKLRQFRKLSMLPVLETLIVSENPVSGDDGEQGADGEDGEDGDAPPPDDEEVEGEGDEKLDPFRLSILVLLPNLKRINKLIVTANERVSAEMQRDYRYPEIMDEESSRGSLTAEFIGADAEDAEMIQPED